MAMPYPEGEMFFRRSALRVSEGNGDHAWSFNADNAKDFASHILIEYIYNRAAGYTGKRCHSVYSEVGGKKYYRPSSFNIMFSDTQEETETPAGQGHKPRGVQMLRMVEVGTLSDAKEYRDNTNGGPDKVTIMPIPVEKNERYMFIDLVMPVRAIYLPLAQKVDDLNPDLCTYIMIDFRYRKGVEMLFTDFHAFDPTGHVGRIFTEEDAAKAIEAAKAAEAAQLVRFGKLFKNFQLVKISEGTAARLTFVAFTTSSLCRGSYETLRKAFIPNDTLIRNHDDGVTTIFNKTPTKVERDFQLLDYSKVISDHFGVDVTWQPYEYSAPAASLVSQIFFLGVETGINLIPVVGPLASTGFSIFMEAINDTEEFEKNDILKLKSLKNKKGELVGTEVMKDAVETAAAIAKNVAKRGKGKKAGSAIAKLVTS